jgi:hypothetical protein
MMPSLDSSSQKRRYSSLTEIVIKATAAPMLARRMYKIIEGKSLSSAVIDVGSEAEFLFGESRVVVFVGSIGAAVGPLLLESNQEGVSAMI